MFDRIYIELLTVFKSDPGFPNSQNTVFRCVQEPTIYELANDNKANSG
jgi:hypothetical protein